MTFFPINNTINHQSNNFDFLRLCAAIFVMFGHSYALVNMGSNEPLTKVAGGIYFGGLGVDIFFVISGYLILSSWERHPELLTFFKNRILRIFPALIVVVCITALVLGAIITTLTLKEYFININTWTYLETMTLYQIQYTLPGVFENNLYKCVVNGSLWTLPTEFSFYILLAILGLVGIYRKKILILISFIVLVLSSTLYPTVLTEITIPILNESSIQACELAIFFFAGMTYYLYRDKLVFDWRLLLILFGIWVASFNSVYLVAASSLFIPYLVMYFAYLPNKKLNSFGKIGDFSYGTYIIAFPVQQTIIYVFHNNIHPLTLFIFSLVVTLPLAATIWYLVEQPVLKLKNRVIPRV